MSKGWPKRKLVVIDVVVVVNITRRIRVHRIIRVVRRRRQKPKTKIRKRKHKTRSLPYNKPNWLLPLQVVLYHFFINFHLYLHIFNIILDKSNSFIQIKTKFLTLTFLSVFTLTFIIYTPYYTRSTNIYKMTNTDNYIDFYLI